MMKLKKLLFIGLLATAMVVMTACEESKDATYHVQTTNEQEVIQENYNADDSNLESYTNETETLKLEDNTPNNTRPSTDNMIGVGSDDTEEETELDDDLEDSSDEAYYTGRNKD